MMGKYRKFALVGRLGCLVALVLALVGCTSRGQEQTKENSVRVKTVKVKAEAHAVSKNFMGVVEEEDGANVTFGVIGTVVRVSADEGQFVRQGQPLAEVDGVTVRNAYEMSAATLRQAEDAYRRMKDLYDKGTLPEIKMVEMETMLAKARAAEAMSRKSVGEIVLRAPFDGFVASRNVHVGASAAPGMTGFRLVKIDRVKVKLSVPECEIGKVAKGQKVTFTVGALGDSVFSAIVTTRGVAANAINHTYSVSAVTPNPQHVLLPGMVCKARLESVSDSYAIIVPHHAVLVSGSNQFVWLVRNGKAHRQPVTTGDVQDEGVVVESGLSAGDVVIVGGQNKVSEDTQVIAEEEQQ